MMERPPVAPFEMIETEFVLELLVVPLDPLCLRLHRPSLGFVLPMIPTQPA